MADDRRNPRFPPKPPPGYRFDPFADARMGRSLFDMRPEDWLEREESAEPEA